MEKICIYLRKSRADEEAEKHGEGETLAKHKKILLKTAAETGLHITKIHEEIASGESLIHRPAMLELLKEVESGRYNAVLCMDIDRLGRGNMQEQGLILETFKSTATKIITPRKIYDLNDEWDEEYSEFEAFMARKELKLINRRLQRGRIRAVEDGNYIATLPPYGYQISRDGRERSLTPHPEQAPIVRLIFSLYTQQNLGSSKIAEKLNTLGYKTYTGKHWSSYSVLNILKNEVYTGKVQWQKTRTKKSSKENQAKEIQKRPYAQWINVPGKHEAIISEADFQKAKEILNTKSHTPHTKKVTNPLAGLIKCQICGASMVYRPYTKSEPHLVCYNKCGNKSTKFSHVENALLYTLKKWLIGYKADFTNPPPQSSPPGSDILEIQKKALKNLKTTLQDLENQKNKLHDLLEQGIYDADTYNQRSQLILEKIQKTKENLEKNQEELQSTGEIFDMEEGQNPKVEMLLDLYDTAENPALKNRLLKAVLHYAEYQKESSQKNDAFTLILYPKLPRQPITSITDKQ